MDGVRALDLTQSHESHAHYVRAGGPAITFCAVTCWCWLTMLRTTVEGSILFFQLVIRITVNSNVTSFPALNADVWAKWNAPLILINVMNWSSIWTLLHSLGVCNWRPGQYMLKAVCCSGAVEMSICTSRPTFCPEGHTVSWLSFTPPQNYVPCSLFRTEQTNRLLIESDFNYSPDFTHISSVLEDIFAPSTRPRFQK